MWTTNDSNSLQTVESIFSIPFIVDYSISGLEDFECFSDCPNFKCSDTSQIFYDIEGDGCYDRCRDCPEGSSASADQITCVPCLPGQYKDTSSGICQNCPSGTYTPSSGTTECLDCTGGREVNAAGNSCDCPPGEFYDEDSYSCETIISCIHVGSCPNGRIPVDNDSDPCTDICQCPTGQVWNGTTCALPLPSCSDSPSCSGGELLDDNKDGCPNKCICPSTEYILSEGSCQLTCSHVTCRPDQKAVDNDADLCTDICECPKFSCPIGELPEDSDSGGCNDTCVTSCTDITCLTDEFDVNNDSDSCTDICNCLDFFCAYDQNKIDTNNGGCPDACECKPEPTCATDELLVDLNSNGCKETCVSRCPENQVWDVGLNKCCDSPPICASDQRLDGSCPGTCVCDVTCSSEQTPVDSNNNGCPESCTTP